MQMIFFVAFVVFVCVMNITSKIKLNNFHPFNLSLYHKDDYEYISRRTQVAFYEGMFIGSLVTAAIVQFGGL